jgi:hypothetical protein
VNTIVGTMHGINFKVRLNIPSTRTSEEIQRKEIHMKLTFQNIQEKNSELPFNFIKLYPTYDTSTN